jgi:hypothetical protein
MSETRLSDVEVLEKLREVVELYKVLVKDNKELENIFVSLVQCLNDVEKLLKGEYINVLITQHSRLAVVCQVPIQIPTETVSKDTISTVRRLFLEEKWPRILEVIVMWLRKIVEGIRNKLYMVETRRKEEEKEG